MSFWGTLRCGDAGDVVRLDDTTGIGMAVMGMEGAEAGAEAEAGVEGGAERGAEGGTKAGGEDRTDGGAWLHSGLESSLEVR